MPPRALPSFSTNVIRTPPVTLLVEVVGTREFTVIEEVGGNALTQNHRRAGTDEEAVASNFRTRHRKAFTCASWQKLETTEYAVDPNSCCQAALSWGSNSDSSYFPFIGGSRPQRPCAQIPCFDPGKLRGASEPLSVKLLRPT